MNELSNQIYESIQDSIKNVIEKLSSQQAQKQLKEETSNAISNLNQLNIQLQDELEKLKANSEWRRFCIAFYGETNAGKSTLIEALRLQLGEETKLKAQQKFKEIQAQFGLTQEAFDEVRSTIINVEQAIEDYHKERKSLLEKFAQLILKAEVNIQQEELNAKQSLDELLINHNKAVQNINYKINELDSFLKKLYANNKWWKKLIFVFLPPIEKKQLTITKANFLEVEKQQENEKNNLIEYHQMLKQQAENELILLQKDKSKEEILLDKKQKELKKVKIDAEIEKQRLDDEAKKLTDFADGQIIGDGRSDFTRENTEFDFELEGQLFTLIDVPGIEGNESIVSRPIKEAVRKAHAVFYVTRTPRPPQTNDSSNKNSKGTLEKIKEHLGAQSEVWSIYNHPAKNPLQLTSPLLNEDNSKSLVAMDEKLKLELKDQYCGSLVVSARPAYLALTECIVPGSKEASEKRKFLKSFGNSQTILSLSGLTNFIAILQTTIIDDYRNKILRSNLNKAYKALEMSLIELDSLKITFLNLKKELSNEYSNTKSQIAVSLEEFVSNLNVLGSKIRRDFHNAVQENVYEEIKDDISNNKCKTVLENTLKNEAEKIQKKLKKGIDKQVNELGEKVNKIIERSTEHLRNIVSIKSDNLTLNKNFNFKIDVDNGLKLGSLFASSAGAIAAITFLASNPVGWTITFVGGVIAIFGSLIGMVKSLYAFFDSSYKQSQQRKELDKALRKASQTIETDVNKIIDEMRTAMFDEIKKMEKQLEEPVNECSAINFSLNQAYNELDNIARNIKYKKGGLI